MRQKVKTHSLSPPDPTLNPVLHHHTNTIMNKRRDDKDDKFALSLTRTTTEKGKATLHTISFKLSSKNADATISNNNRKKLVRFFQLLHPVLVLSSKQMFQHWYECI